MRVGLAVSLQPWTQFFAHLSNLFPGLMLEARDRSLLRPGGCFVESYHPGQTRQADERFRELGFSPLGVLLSSFSPGWALRGYAHRSLSVWAVHYLGVVWGSEFDLVTEFQDGSWLTTTSHFVVPAYAPPKRLHSHPGQTPEQLWNRHLAERDSLDLAAVEVGDLDDLARSIRRYFHRPRTT